MKETFKQATAPPGQSRKKKPDVTPSTPRTGKEHRLTRSNRLKSVKKKDASNRQAPGADTCTDVDPETDESET